jgi:hypothetical protein
MFSGWNGLAVVVKFDVVLRRAQESNVKNETRWS